MELTHTIQKDENIRKREEKMKRVTGREKVN